MARGDCLRIGISCFPTVGGSGTLATALGEDLAARGHEVHFICYERPFRLPEDMPRIHFHPVAVNDYEGKMLSQRTGWSLAEISKRVEGLVVTLAAEGCEVWTNGEREHVPAVTPAAVVEPTGCGDAWRGALLFGLEQGWALARCAALGNHLGALKIAQRGPQNYQVDRKALGL